MPSFGAAVDCLAAAGLAFDPVTRTGVVLVCDFKSADGTVAEYCVVAEDFESVDASERQLMTLFTKTS